jgi:UDP-N-acetyl-D-galactosamine dehydrogenase
MPHGYRIAVIGLGYVGLPLAVELSKHFSTIGFDISAARVAELLQGHDRTNEVESSVLRAGTLTISADRQALADCNVYIITVPTPLDERNLPDLGAVISASATIADLLKKGDIVVLESTVYPGVTEDVVGPTLAERSGLVSGTDFFLGYSPERINPGDRVHSIAKVTKVVAGQDERTTDVLAEIYGSITGGNIYRAASIRVAEAAKVIENTQRDVNIAFINELSMIFGKMGISIYDVLDAASTKWNFLSFVPGLVGGHCIGVDPVYLAESSLKAGHLPELIMAGRRINEFMCQYIADRISARIAARYPAGRRARVLVLGVTFKENVPDIRNSKVFDLIGYLREHGHDVHVHDPHADPDEVRGEYQVDMAPTLEPAMSADCLVLAVQHREYRDMPAEALSRLVVPNGLIYDLKALWRGRPGMEQFEYVTL